VNPLDTPEDQLDSEARHLRNGRLAVSMGGDGVDLPNEPGRERGLLEAALAQLRLKLLDLTGRNRLLNFKHTAGRSLQFVEGAPIALYERLVEGNNRPTAAIQGLPEPERREWAERNGRLARPDPREWAQRNGVPTGYDLPEGTDQPSNYVRALFYQDDLAKHCRKLEREATLAIEETGSNMLFLVLGFLEYPDQRDSDRLFSAPLVSVPVSLSRKDVSGKQTFYIQYTGEDISDNISLREKLKNDYGILIPALFDEDRASDEPVNVAAYFTELRKIINDHPRFALKNRASLALLSFTNMLLVRDLDPKKWPEKNGVHALLDHAIVRQIFEGQSDGGGSYGDAADHPVEDDPGAKIQLVYDADSSQHSALVDVLFGGKNIVIEGPPGTGKSQTITNLIAASIAEGKRVLFIAEKLAALDVVRTRLSSAGLSAFVLELHSNKTSKKKVLEELNNRIDFRTNLPTDLPLKLQRLEESRRELKRYSDLANSVVYNRLGLTLHELMWRAERHRSRITIGEATLFNLSISDACDLSAFELARRMDALEHLGAQFNAIGGFGKEKPFWGFEPETIVPGDENRLEELLLNGREWADTFATDGGTFVASIGGGPAGLSLDEGRKQLATLAELRAGHTGRDPVHLLARLFASDGTGVRSKRLVDDLDNHLSRFQALEPAATRGVRAEDQVSAERLAALRELSRAASTLGIPLSTSAELAERHAILRSAVEPLGASAEVIGKFCDRRKIPFDGSLAKLVKLTELARVVAAAPESALAVQCAGLARDSAVADINRLRDLQSEWDILCFQTAQVLYIDIPPADQRLEDAITTLRQGTAWYRVFDGKWRSAIALHKSLQRSKQKVSAEERLQQLERVRSLKQLRGRLDGDTAWQACLGISPPTELFPLDEYLAVAQWNRDFLAALEDMTVTDISVAELTPETARALRREFAELGEAISTITASLGVMRDALPGLVGLAGGKSVQSVREAVIGFTDKLDAELPWLEMNCPGGAIVIDGSTPEGTRALRNYLEYARTGQLTVPEDTGAAPDSDFEVAVMDVLRMRGYEVTPQLGVAGYRIDIAVKHPDAPGTYLAAIECDGASYHSAASVRDRDRIRQDILESVGWRGRIWRIWSTDWFRTPRQETEKLLSFLDDLRKSWKPEHSSGASWVEEGTAPIPRPADVPANEADRRVVSQVLLETDEEIEVAVGDIVRYAEVSQPTDVLTVRIVRSASDLANGLISVSAPLAQTLLGGVVGDEVVLHVPGSPARVFRILEIKRSE